MKKMMVLLLTLCLALSAAPALAEATDATAGYSGTVEATRSVTVTAPFGGQLADFALRVGDVVRQGDPLFTLNTVKVYAPADGTVRGLQAKPGDEAAVVSERYGALAYVEPAGRFTVSANTGNAYKSDSNNNINRYLNPGETVYLRCSDDYDRTGVGVITTVDGRNFTVEVLQSNLNLEDTVAIYRDAAFTTDQRLGSNARVQKAANYAVTGEGSVLQCLVSEGQTVKRGDVLFETVTGVLAGLSQAKPQVSAPVDGVVTSLAVQAGGSVAQDAVLATLCPADALGVTFEVDESELDTVVAGAKVSVKLDALTGREALTGTVSSISAVSAQESGDARYTAYVALDSTDGLLLGMSVSVYLQ